MMDDAQLLRRYVQERSQEAFAELVSRHVNVVYFAALRRVGGDSHLADDVAQKVFADLARKAASLQDRTVLTGWLYTSTRFAAAQAVRTEQRRRTHEQEAHTMHELHATPEPDWNQLRPIIDEAMDELNEHEREAVLLRFFENRPLAEVGSRFALSADAARMRVERALDKLRGLLAKRGIVSTSAALAATFAAQSGLSAPASVAARIVAGVAGQAGTATATTFALWKIAAGLAIGALGIGVVLYETMGGKTDETVHSNATPGHEGTAPSVDAAVPGTTKSAETGGAIAGLEAESASVASPASVKPFDGFSEQQKKILKTLWEHRKISSETPLSSWGFRPGPAMSAAVVADFTEAAGLLQAAGLVGIRPKGGAVFLTDEGDAFCRAHAQEIDAYSMRPGAFVPREFRGLPKTEKDILKTLWEHQKISPDQPPLRWGFKIPPDSPDFAAFQAAVAGLHEVSGLVGVSLKTGIVFLTDRGRTFCQTHADELDAYPAPVRVFRPAAPDSKDSSSNP